MGIFGDEQLSPRADFAEQGAARSQVVGGFFQNAARNVEAIFAADMRHDGFVAIFRREGVNLWSRHVGRV